MRQFINNNKWITIILCILVGIYFLWPIIADENSEILDNPIMADTSLSTEQNRPLRLEDGINGAAHEGLSERNQNNSNETPITEGEKDKKQLVYITGAVESPGLYEILTNSSVGDVIKVAGGVLPYGDIESINMADRVSSGDHIHVRFNFTGNPEMLLRTQKININTATEKELDALPGIGPTMAKRITEHRQSKGAFTTIEDIKQVKGIGDGLFKKIHQKITV